MRNSEPHAAGTCELLQVNAIYYFEDRKSVALLARYPEHREAKGSSAPSAPDPRDIRRTQR